MRKLFLLTFLILAIIAHSRQISENEAASIASEFFDSVHAMYNPSKTGVRMVHSRDAEEASDVPFYIFNADGGKGFLIISGDDRAKRILGYSDTGIFDYTDVPPQLADLMNQYAEYLKIIPADTPAHQSWKTTLLTEISDGGLLLKTAEWGQGAPYNSQCPVIDGVNAPTGCVATAMAIIMKYHSWPEKYDWNLMSESETVNGNNPVSALMKEIGESVRTDYDVDVSNAYLGLISQSLFENFGYSHEAQLVALGSGYIGHDEWLDLIYNEINQSRPIIYVGAGGSVAHAFVLDGYDDKGLFHVNWGWDGAYNGYYDLSALTPYDGANFSDGQGMVLSIKPGDNADDNYSRTAYIDYGYLVGLKCYAGLGLNPEVSDIKRNQPVHMSYATLNVRPHTWFGIALIDKDKEIKEILYSEYCSNDKSDDDTGFIHYLGESTVTITSEMEATDRLHLIARDSESSPWKLVRGTIETPSAQPINGIECKLAHIAWSVPDGIAVKYHHCNKTFEGTPETLAKGTLLDIYAYSHTPGTVEININGFNNYSDISSWEYGAIGAVASTYCLDDNIDISISFTPESSYLDIALDTEVPGSLEEKIQSYDLSMIKGLSVNGCMDQRDFVFIKNNLHKLERLDLSKVKIYEYDRYPDNHLPENALSGLSRLKKLVLPDVEVIETLALANLTNLYDIEIPASVKEIQEDAFCYSANLKRIVFKNPIPFKGTESSLTGLFSSYGFIVVPAGASEQYRQAPYASRYSRILEGDLIPATGINLVIDNDDERDSNTLMPLYCLPSIYNIELEPRNSTDYVVGGTTDRELASMDIYSNENGLCCYLSGRNTTGGKTKLILNTSSGAEAEYDIDAVPSIKDLYFEETNLTIYLTENCQLKAKVYPSQYPISYGSSDPDVVSVDSWGNLYPNKEGIATIFATAYDAVNTLTATCDVVVAPVKVSSISLNPSSAEGAKGEQIQITATVLPENATNRVIDWSSSDGSVATVDNTGLISLIKDGTAVITASATDGSGISADCAVVVKEISGIENILTDKYAYIKVFNLQGLLIYEGLYSEANLSPDYYIVVCDGKNIKVKVE